MRNDVENWAAGEPIGKIPSKETLNHRELIMMASGIDPMLDTLAAYRVAYERLGIDIVNRVPMENAPAPTPAGAVRQHPSKPYLLQSLGVYDTASRSKYQCASVDDLWSGLDTAEIEYGGLLTPVPHSCEGRDIQERERCLGDVGVYYPMLYTTLFMWAVEVLGWEIFMEAAISEPERFHKLFIEPFAKKSVRIVAEIAASSSCPFVFLHDDLASGRGPVFPPSWYEERIFPHYREIFAPAKAAGKKIFFVADGDMTAFLPRLVELGVDGLMFENPATPVEAVVEHFGVHGRFFIGGIETAKLTFGSPDEVATMVRRLMGKVEGRTGFAMASCGGLHGNIPLENLAAYFDARAEFGITPKDWRQKDR